MLLDNLITEKTSVWEQLKNCSLPICVYGMGDGAEKLIDIFNSLGVTISEFFASDDFVRGHSFHGFRVKKLSEIESTYDDFMIVIAFGSQLPEVLSRVKAMSLNHKMVIPDMPVAGNNLFTPEFAREHEAEILKAYDLMADEKSKEVFKNTLNYKISGKPEYLWASESDKEEVFTELFKFGDNESYLDLGAYRGDTVDEFLHYAKGKYNEIFAFEADSKTYKKLAEHCENIENCHPFNLAAWDKETQLYFDRRGGRNSHLSTEKAKFTVEANAPDNIVGSHPVTYIKMDVEGAEEEALRGCEKTIKANLPKLNIAGYHRSEDIFKIPLIINKLSPDYKIYLRHHPYFPAWDNNFYAVSGK